MTYGYSRPLLTSITATGPAAGMVGFSYDNNFRIVGTTVAGSSVGFGL